VLKKGKKVEVEKQVPDPVRQLAGRIYALDLGGDAWLASTAAGLLTSHDRGVTWQGGPVLGSSEYVSCAAHGATLAAAQRDGVVVSTDAGQTWTRSTVPTSITRIYRAAFSGDGTLWLGTREGVYLSHDQGKTWTWIERLPLRDVNDIYYDTHLDKMLVSSRNSDWVFALDTAGSSWTWTRAGWKIFLIRASQDRLLAASLYDGVLVQPKLTWNGTARQ
jgi:ligand-binding sensor domain-containing protein